MSPPETDPTAGEPENASASRKRTHPDDFKRAYKACINCRQRKAKCILDANPEGELKPPCQRCKREMRECVFRSERSWVKRRKPGEARAEETTAIDDTAPAQANGTGITPPTSRPLSIPHYIASPADSSHSRRSESLLSPATLRRVSTSQPDLAHSVMRTVVSSGSDALNLLFEAAHHRDAIENQEQQANSQVYETPQSGTPGYGQGKPVFGAC